MPEVKKGAATFSRTKRSASNSLKRKLHKQKKRHKVIVKAVAHSVSKSIDTSKLEVAKPSRLRYDFMMLRRRSLRKFNSITDEKQVREVKKIKKEIDDFLAKLFEIHARRNETLRATEEQIKELRAANAQIRQYLAKN